MRMAQIVAALLLCPVFGVWAESPNLLINPSFEKQEGKTPAGWQIGTLKGAPYHSTLKTTAQVHGGAHAAVLRLDKRDTWVLIDQRVKPTFAKGDQYIFRVWLKAQKAVEISISLSALCPTIGKVYDRHVACKLTPNWKMRPTCGSPTHSSSTRTTCR